MAIDPPQQKTYQYKVYDSLTGLYLGNLQNVVGDFAFSQDINSSGAQITVDCAITIDTSSLSSATILDENGANVLDENSVNVTDEGTAPAVSIGTSEAFIRDGNTIRIYEYGYWHPNGVCLFRGVIEKIQSSLGGDTGDEKVTLTVYCDAQDLNNKLVYGPVLTLDQSQTVQNDSIDILDNLPRYIRIGQTWTTGNSVTSLTAISVMLATSGGSRMFVLNVYTNQSDVYNGIPPIASSTQSVTSSSPIETQFIFGTPISVTANTQYFFYVSAYTNNIDCFIYLNDNANSYGGGEGYLSDNVFSGGAWLPNETDGGGNDLHASIYFKTYYGTLNTTATFISKDPTIGMLEPFLDVYNNQGGLIQYTGASIDATGLSLSYGFNTNTIDEGLQAILSISPSGFYYYIDLGSDTLFFKKTNTTADITLIKGVHLNQLVITSTIEYVINACYVVGGLVAGNNIFTYDQDDASVALYGQRITRHTDSNIPDSDTAHTVGQNIIATNKTEQYQTVVSIVDKTMDTTTIKLGLVVGFSGFGTFADNLLAQIVHIDYTPEQVTVTLGILLTRTVNSVEQITRGLLTLNTIDNPTNPS